VDNGLTAWQCITLTLYKFKVISSYGLDGRIHDAFAEEFTDFDAEVKIGIEAGVIALREFGPQLGRPHVDTLNDSKHANMKELRFAAADGVWRIAFAFDPRRSAILLVAGDKSGIAERRFYKRLIAQADERFDEHLKTLKAGG
jgi:hypothetical protein